MNLRTLLQLVKQAAIAWNANQSPTYGAALAYYTIFSLAPLLLIAISMASLVLGEEAARTGISSEIRSTLGPITADAVEAMLANAYNSGGSGAMTLVGLVTLVLGA